METCIGAWTGSPGPSSQAYDTYFWDKAVHLPGALIFPQR